jgi:Tfp pilus assembly protein PilO
VGNLGSNTVKLIVGAVAVIALVVAFMYGYRPLNEKVDTVNDENQTLQNEIDVLKSYAANEKKMRAEIEEYENGIDQLASAYAVEITPEDSIKIMRDMETATDTEVTNVAFQDEENIYASTFTTDSGENVLGGVTPIVINYNTSYDGLKKVMDYINNYPQHMNVRDFTATYNQETGKLTGVMTINRYTMTGFGKTYKEPAISDVRLSTKNIFHTIK